MISMIKCALTNCSTYQRLSTKFKKIRKIGVKDGYPKSFINTLIGVNLTQHLNTYDDGRLAPAMTMNDQAIATAMKFNENNKKCMYVEVPFIDDSTIHAMKKKMLHLSNKLRLNVNIRFYTTPPPPIQTFCKNKDPIVKHMQSDVIYSVQCIHCQQTYVGKAER